MSHNLFKSVHCPEVKEKDANLLREKKAGISSGSLLLSKQLTLNKRRSTRIKRTLKLRGLTQYPQKSSLHKLKITQLRIT